MSLVFGRVHIGQNLKVYVEFIKSVTFLNNQFIAVQYNIWYINIR